LSDPFQVLRWDIVKTIFAEEVEYLKARRWDFAQHKPDFLIALNADLISLHHLDQIRRMIDIEAKEKAKAEEDAKKKVRDGTSLTGGYIRQ
jgi:hypothetical protein